jgi:phage-related tail protein
MDLLIDFDRLAGNLSKSEVHSQRRSELKRDKSKWGKAIADTDKTLSTAYSHHLDGLLDLKEFELVRDKVERDKREAAAKLAQAESDLKKYDEMADRHTHWHKVYSDFLGIETPTKELIQSLISRIELTPITNELHVIFNYMDGLTEYRELLEESGVSESA